MADIVNEIRERGRWRAIVVGGCCMTVHTQIRGLAATLRAR
jgi:S-methylmethionine-dependent homocysteine/selenocysteine methylase